MIEALCLKNVVIFLQTISSFVLSRKMTNKHYQKHKERLGKEAREIYKNLSEEVKCRKGSRKISKLY